MHESFRNDDKVKLPSERSFGIVFTVFFAVIALLPIIRGHQPLVWAAVVSLVFLLVALTRPRTLRPLNWLWFKFGLLLHKIISPVVMFMIFAVAIVPTGFIRRFFVTDPLHLLFDKSAKSYWIKRDPPGPMPETFRDQF